MPNPEACIRQKNYSYRWCHSMPALCRICVGSRCMGAVCGWVGECSHGCWLSSSSATDTASFHYLAFYHLASCNAIRSLIGFSTIPVSLGPLSSRPHCPPHHFHTNLRRHQSPTTGSLSKHIQGTCLRHTLMVSFTQQCVSLVL